MEQDKPEYQGTLLLPPNGKILIKKTWQQKYCVLYKSGKFGIARLEVYDSSDVIKSTPSRIITLENCIKITQKSPTYFSLMTRTATYEFGTFSVNDLTHWLKSLQAVAFPDEISRISSIEEDNDLYCSSGEGVFSVKLHPSKASIRCGLEPKSYTLVLTSTAIQLRDDTELLYTWPYCFIRRYGYRDGKFTFEAGRKCESGEGTFYLEHCNQHEIYRCLASKMKSMKKLLKGESSPSLLECGDNQFHAALSMEARSRSPLPPSPTTSTMLHDIETNISTKPLIPVFEPITKIKPLKPPRKTLPIKEKDPSDDYEPTNKYDEVEYRSDAWKTLGVDDVKHTDNVHVEEEEEYVSWGQKKERKAPLVQTNKAPKIIKQVSTTSLDDTSYDTLNFFGSSSKLAKSGYKQVSPAPIIAQPLPCPPSFNDYDEVGPTLEGVRPADDSHLGYALIRKEPKVDHQFHNEEPYAVISKPKRV